MGENVYLLGICFQVDACAICINLKRKKEKNLHNQVFILKY